MRIVVGYDGSDPAKHALDRVARYGTGNDEVTVVTVAELHARAGVTEGAHLDPSELPRRQQALEEAKAALAERGLQAETVVAQGDPGEAIVQVAEERNAELIVVGHRGLNPFERLLLGSVSSKVVHRAPCDVLVVR
ncbi:MAG TPA: universal stress protein [Solirubrobacteraceae bacterium]|jgi:nucleotide-binding universal stress UspA family protein|nr:universal stress protein [Solirubrobacteraceae bacterium]